MTSNLESEIRKRLAEMLTEELYEFIRNSNLLQKVAEKVTGRIAEAIAFLEEEVEEEELEDMKKELFSIVIAYLEDPEQLKQLIYEQVRGWCAPYDETKARIEEEIRLVERKFGEDAAYAYREAAKLLLRYARITDEFFKRLTDIAEKTSITNALQKETLYAVIRDMFPTIEDYKRFLAEVKQVREAYSRQVSQALQMGGKMGQAAAMIYDVTQEISAELTDLFEDYWEVELRKIYESSK